MRIRFKRPDTRAGQELEVDEATGRRAIEAGEAVDITHERRDARGEQAEGAGRGDKASSSKHGGTPAKKTGGSGTGGGGRK